MSQRAWALVIVAGVASAIVAVGGAPGQRLGSTTQGAQGTISSGVTQQGIALADSVLPVLAKSKLVGSFNKSAVLHITVSLNPRDPQGLQAFADSVSNPNSANYHKFISPSEVGERFGATDADVTAVATYMANNGMSVTLISDNRMAITADATVAQVEKAFGTTVNQYQGPSPDNKQTYSFHANATPLYVPANIGKTVLSVFGVEDYTRPKPRANTSTLLPFLTNVYTGINPSFTAGYHGEGRNVAISNFDGYRLANIPFFTSQFGIPVPAGGAGSNIAITVVGTAAGPGSAGGEGDLDIQMVVAMSPLANIRIYDSTNDIVGVLTREANDNTADVITESYGWQLPASFATSCHNQHLSMTSQGITYMAASGDDGTTLEPFAYPDYDPEVLMVGGSVVTVNDTTGVRVGEVGWSGSGGGWSTNTATFNVLPSWQKGTGVPTNNNHRLVPDLSLHASANSQTTGGYVFAYGGAGQFFVGDGTSFSSPVFAGGLTTLSQRLFQNSSRPASPRSRLGRIQDMIYAQNGRTDIWTDITSGNNGTLPSGGNSACTAKWDMVTGWGTINFDAFYKSFLGARP